MLIRVRGPIIVFIAYYSYPVLFLCSTYQIGICYLCGWLSITFLEQGLFALCQAQSSVNETPEPWNKSRLFSPFLFSLVL